MKIEDWYCTTGYYLKDFCLPTIDVLKIGGIIYDHPFITDGSYIKTQEIVKWDEKDVVISSDGDVWELGMMDPLFKLFLENEQYLKN